MSPFPSSPVRDVLAGMLAMAVAMGIGRFAYTPLVPAMMEALDLSASDAGLIASANYAGYLIGAVLGAGRWGGGHERTIALTALLASALLAAAVAMADTMPAFLLLRFLAGIASALVMVFSSTIIIARLALARRMELQGWHFGGVGFGIACSSLLILVLNTYGADWRWGWVGAAILSLAGLAAVALLMARAPASSAPAAPEPPMPLSGPLLRIILAYGLFGFGYIVTATFLIAIVRTGGAGQSFEAVVWMVTGLIGIPSIWLWSRLSPRVGLAGLFALACTVEALGVMASVAIGGYAGPLIAGILMGGTFMAITAIGIQHARTLAGGASRQVVAWMTASFGTGQIIGPIVAGAVADRTGDFYLASVLAAAVLALAAICALAARGPRAGA